MPKLTMTLKLITEQILNKSFNIFRFSVFFLCFFHQSMQAPCISLDPFIQEP